MSAPERGGLPSAEAGARNGLAHRFRHVAILDVEGADREAFLQGQLTQDVRGLAPGASRPAAALTPRGKILFPATIVGGEGRLRLIVPASCRSAATDHLRKYAVFQKVVVSDRSDELACIGLYGPRASNLEPPSPEAVRLPASAEFAAQWLLPAARAAEAEALLGREGSVAVDAELGEVLRVEAGRPRFGRDIDGSWLPDEAGLDAAVSTTKGCYVGQEIVARRRVYGRPNRRLTGFHFPDGPIEIGTSLARTPGAPEKVEAGRVTSSVVSRRLGAIGLGFAAHDVADGQRLVPADAPGRAAIVATLPFP